MIIMTYFSTNIDGARRNASLAQADDVLAKLFWVYIMIYAHIPLGHWANFTGKWLRYYYDMPFVLISKYISSSWYCNENVAAPTIEKVRYWFRRHEYYYWWKWYQCLILFQYEARPYSNKWRLLYLYLPYILYRHDKWRARINFGSITIRLALMKILLISLKWSTYYLYQLPPLSYWLLASEHELY